MDCACVRGNSICFLKKVIRNKRTQKFNVDDQKLCPDAADFRILKLFKEKHKPCKRVNWRTLKKERETKNPKYRNDGKL